MSLKPVNYISLSALSYIDFNSSMKNKTIEHLVNNKLIKEDDLSSPELSTLQNSSNPLRSWRLINFLPNNQNGLSAAVFQNPETKESRCNIGMICSINKEYVYA